MAHPVTRKCLRLVAKNEKQRSITSGKRTTNEAVAFQASVKRSVNSNKAIYKSEKPTRHCDFFNRDGHTHVRDVSKWWTGKNKQEKGIPEAACAKLTTTSSGT
uniref:Uncharacterized protein n=1 Tax=Lactuca sativa TaxID=4236 RepID=A0A9R1WDQ7_LACSA|nr:hypothetical protein LSAT_V11C200070820 [Lactuca sativa]